MELRELLVPPDLMAEMELMEVRDLPVLQVLAYHPWSIMETVRLLSLIQMVHPAP